MNTFRIFIASSSELRNDRDAFREFLSVENDRLHQKGVYLELIQWEYFIDAVSKTRMQDEYNKAILECDIVISLFYSKAGKYTLEEFNTCYEQFINTGKPLIYTYFKTGAPDPDPAIEQQKALIDLKRRLYDIGHFFTNYENSDSLKYLFRKQLDRLEDKGLLILQEQQKFLTGNKPYNEFLSKKIVEAIADRNCVPAKRFLKRVANIQNWDKNVQIINKAKEIIAYSFAGVIGIQLSKLMAIGKEEDSRAKQRKYIQKCLNIAKRCCDLINFSMISKIWDQRKTKEIFISEAQKITLKKRLDNIVEPNLKEQFTLLKDLYHICEKNEFDISILEIKSELSDQFKKESTLQNICSSLYDINVRFDQNDFCLEDCFDAEVLLANFFEYFGFLVNYKMASIKEIGYKEIRNTIPHYLHSYTALGIDSKANIDAEKMMYTHETVQTDSVLLYKGTDYCKAINLFPFVIDYNALTFERGTKICFYRSKDVVDGCLDYMFLEDNKIYKLEKGILNNSEETINEIMINTNKRKKYNLLNVVLSFEHAQQSLLGEVNLDDI